MELGHTNSSAIKIHIRFQEFAGNSGINFPAPGESDVRVPRTQFGLERCRQSGFLNAFVNLKKMWMSTTNADPDNLWRSRWWEGPNPGDREKKCTELDDAQFLAELEIDLFGNASEKTEREVHLLPCDPTHTMNVWIQISEKFLERFWYINRNK
jgi:hypothetical protein